MLSTRERGYPCVVSLQVMFMAYHSEVLQKERDLRRRTHLSPLSGKSTETAEDGAAGLRRAGGDGQSPFTAMAEAALAQARRLDHVAHYPSP